MTDKIQRTQEALVNSHMRTIKALKDSLQELQAQGLIRPFRISLAVSKDQEEQIEDGLRRGESHRRISARTGVAKSAVSARAKKANNSNGKSARAGKRASSPQGKSLNLALTVATEAADWTGVTQEIVSAARAVAQAWQRTAEHLAIKLKEEPHGKKED